MSDHVDGPRQIGDPASDLTDLFAFTSPENPGRTVLALDVFPSAGVSAMFSNVVNHEIVVRHVTVAGLGEAAKFKAGDQEYRFNCRFSDLEHGPAGTMPIQRGTCTFPDGQKLDFVVNDEKGASTPDGVFRVFAGLRSDPFFLAWFMGVLKKAPISWSMTTCSVDRHRIRHLAAHLIPTKARSSGSLRKPVRCLHRRRPSAVHHHVSIGLAAQNRRTCVLIMRPWRGMTCATYGISRLRLPLPRSSSPSSASAY